MKIGIEAQRIFRRRKHGMDVVAIELIKNLQQIDKANEYTIFGRSGVNDVFEETSNFHISAFSAFSYLDWEQINLVQKVKKVKPDFLHCTANTAPLFSSVPLIVTIHDIIYLEQITFKGSAYQNLGNLYRRFIVPKVAKKAKLILTVSEFEKQNIVSRLNLPDDKVRVIYNGVGEQFNNQYSANDVQAFRRKYGLPSQFIMFLGNTAPKKNTSNVIRAYVDYCLSEKEAVPIVLLDYKKEMVIKRLQESGYLSLLNKFIFPGYVPYHQMPLMYNGASLFLYPSLRESFGLPILEAMACGTPVITSNTSSMPEIGGDAAKQVDPFNYLEIAEAIRTLMRNNSSQNNFIEKGLERVKDFRWEVSAEKLLKIYHSFQ